MGWCDDSGEHEGYIVGLIQTEPNGSALRELSYFNKDNDAVGEIRLIQAACSCGWRSSRIAAPYGTFYSPHHIATSPEMEEIAHQLWLLHSAPWPPAVRTSPAPGGVASLPWSREGECLMPFDALDAIRRAKDKR